MNQAYLEPFNIIRSECDIMTENRKMDILVHNSVLFQYFGNGGPLNWEN